MSFEYIIDYPCKVRKELGENANGIMTTAVNNKNRYELLAKQREKSAEEITVGLQTLNESVSKTVACSNLEPLKGSFMEFEKYQERCSNCPCNLMKDYFGTETFFGCYGSIRYPFSRKFEKILVTVAGSILIDGMDKPAGNWLKIMQSHPNIGDRASYLRERYDSYFESNEVVYIADGRKGVIEPDGLQYFCTNNDLIGVFLEFGVDAQHGKHVYLPFLDQFKVYCDASAEKDAESIENDVTIQDVLVYRHAIKLAVKNNASIGSRL